MLSIFFISVFIYFVMLLYQFCTAWRKNSPPTAKLGQTLALLVGAVAAAGLLLSSVPDPAAAELLWLWPVAELTFASPQSLLVRLKNQGYS